MTYYNYCTETKFCKFADRSYSKDVQHHVSVDFIIVVVLSAANAVWWVSDINGCSNEPFVYVTESAKQVLSAQNAPIHFIISIFFLCRLYNICKFY